MCGVAPHRKVTRSMNKWLIAIIVVLILVGGWYVARNQRYTPPWDMPKTADVTHGDIRVPITAAGLIHANQVVDVKSKASGEVIGIPVVEGAFVKKGDILVVLKKDDEQRTLDQRRADLERAEALLTQAQVAYERADTAIANAEAQLQEAAANASISQFELEKVEAKLKSGEKDIYSPQQVNNTRAQHTMNLSRQKQADIAVATANLAKRDAEANVKSQEATVRSTRKAVEDAEERLSETTIYAPQDAIVTGVLMRVGMLVQSAIQTFTGGTSLMTLADVSKKKVIAKLDEADYGRVLAISPVDALPDMPSLRASAAADAAAMEKRSGKVRITVDAFPNRSFEGTISRVEPQGRLAAGSSVIQFDVHVEITDADRQMLPLGAQAQVEFTVESAANVMRVPADAVKAFEEQRGVWVKVEPPAGAADRWGKRWVPCRLGISDGEFTEIIEPIGGAALKDGDVVYTKLPPSDGEPKHP